MHSRTTHSSSIVRRAVSDLVSFADHEADSGHGGQTKDLDGDEGDGYDEVIYPVDYKQAGHIVDDVRAPLLDRFSILLV